MDSTVEPYDAMRNDDVKGSRIHNVLGEDDEDLNRSNSIGIVNERKICNEHPIPYENERVTRADITTSSTEDVGISLSLISDVNYLSNDAEQISDEVGTLDEPNSTQEPSDVMGNDHVKGSGIQNVLGKDDKGTSS